MSLHSSFSHIGPGYAFGGKRAEVMAKRLAYIRKHGSAWLLNGKAPPEPGWPALPTAPRARKAKHSRKPDPAKRAMQKAVIAEHVADGGTVKAAAALLGISQSHGSNLWREIVVDMGTQAC